jgi:hypothetical protein
MHIYTPLYIGAGNDEMKNIQRRKRQLGENLRHRVVVDPSPSHDIMTRSHFNIEHIGDDFVNNKDGGYSQGEYVFIYIYIYVYKYICIYLYI